MQEAHPSSCARSAASAVGPALIYLYGTSVTRRGAGAAGQGCRRWAKARTATPVSTAYPPPKAPTAGDLTSGLNFRAPPVRMTAWPGSWAQCLSDSGGSPEREPEPCSAAEFREAGAGHFTWLTALSMRSCFAGPLFSPPLTKTSPTPVKRRHSRRRQTKMLADAMEIRCGEESVAAIRCSGEMVRPSLQPPARVDCS
jgi:hypothetical protein